MLVSPMGASARPAGLSPPGGTDRLPGKDSVPKERFLSSQPPFLPALGALLLERLQALAGQETPPVSCPLPVIQVLFESMNYQPILSVRVVLKGVCQVQLLPERFASNESFPSKSPGARSREGFISGPGLPSTLCSPWSTAGELCGISRVGKALQGHGIHPPTQGQH